jgi:muramoyltetrapeptide carboxypeptidase
VSFGGRELIRPKALRRGARVAVVSPASTPREEKVRGGMARLKELGYEPVLYPSALGGGPLYYAGTVEQRVKDLHAAFADHSIHAVLCTRGGWGSAELLPHLDAALVRKNPKPFVGYSDHTSLHIWLAKECGLISFYGPMVAADFARDEGYEPGSWSAALEGAQSWWVGEAEGLRSLQPGSGEGVVVGGCISIFAAALGTPYSMPPARVDEPRILFLEDIGTKPYQWDRMLLHLRYAGMLEYVTGIVFGDMRQCVAPEEDTLLEAAIRHALRDFAGPIAIGLRSGHVDTPNVTVPLGVRARLDLDSAAGSRLQFLESATI